MKIAPKLVLLLVLLLTFILPIAAHAAVTAPEDCSESSEGSEPTSEECVETGGEQSTTSEGESGATQTESKEEESSTATDPAPPAPEEDPVVRAAQEPTPESTAPPGEQGSLQTSGACFLEVRFLGFDTGQSHVRTEVFAIAPSGSGLIFSADSEEVLALRESGNTVSLIKTYDLSGSVGGLEPTAGGFQVRVVVHVTGEDGKTTTKQKNDRLPCIPAGEVAGPRVLAVAIEGPRAARRLPDTGIEASDYLILASMMFITGWAFLRRAQLQPVT